MPADGEQHDRPGRREADGAPSRAVGNPVTAAAIEGSAFAPGDALVPAERLLLIVVGSNIAAETRDRPVAYRLCERIDGWLRARKTSDAPSDDRSNDADALLLPLVCSDLWYLNDRSLDGRPVIAIGEPSVNAASAMLSARLPTALVIEQVMRLHLDPEFIESQAALWGANYAATESAANVFIERYLDGFMAATV